MVSSCYVETGKKALLYERRWTGLFAEKFCQIFIEILKKKKNETKL